MNRRFQNFIRMMTVGLLLLLISCVTTVKNSSVENTSGTPTIYTPPDTAGPVAGVGIETQDIISMCDKMMRSMMANPILANAASPPHVIVDAVYFHNESTSRLNMNIITDRLRSGLTQHANGRMIFIARHHSDMVEKERKLKREGVVDQATAPQTKKTLGGDYRLGGRITSLDSIAQKTGLTQRYTQIVFEMIDLETSAIVWGGEYSFQKAAADDIIYR